MLAILFGVHSGASFCNSKWLSNYVNNHYSNIIKTGMVFTNCSVMFCPGPSVDIIQSYLSTGTQSGVAFPCPAGTFSGQMGLSNERGCEACPPGRYCSSSGLAAPTGDCSPG